jgi:hypothetical protein
MNETLACSGCGRPLHVPDDLLGQEVKCPACHHTFLAPSTFNGTPVPEAVLSPRQEPPVRPILHGEPQYHAARMPTPGPFQETAEWRSPTEKPQKVQAIAIMLLAGGIIALLVGIGWAITCIGLAFPMTYYSFVVGIMAIVKAARLMGENARNETPPQAVAIMQIVNIVSGDVINLTLGIITLVFLSDPAVKAYFRR